MLRRPSPASPACPLALVAIVGAALLYGDGVITPAISVLAAAEGINFAAGGAFSDGVSPAVAVVVLAVLFTLREIRYRTDRSTVRPVMLVCSSSSVRLGLGGIIGNPAVLRP